MTVRDWLEKAKKEKFAIGAFNVGNLETFRAIVQAAANKRSPVIIESSPGETKWMGAENIVDIAHNYSEEFSIPILVNLDHSESLEDCMTGIEAGYDLIHFDGGKLPYGQNLETVKKVVELAHARGLIVEGELDHIQGSSTVHEGSPEEELKKGGLTDPEKARQFVKESGIDIFAAFFGNVHGVYLGGEIALDIELLQRIASMTGIFLSLHGGSGIPDEQVKEAIQNGVVKVNVNTEMRQSFKDTLEQVLQENAEEYALYKIESPVIEAIQKIVEHKIDVFGSSNKT